MRNILRGAAFGMLLEARRTSPRPTASGEGGGDDQRERTRAARRHAERLTGARELHAHALLQEPVPLRERACAERGGRKTARMGGL